MSFLAETGVTMTVTSATTIREGTRYQCGDVVIWYERKPGKGNRVALFVKAEELTLVTKVARGTDSRDNQAAD